jgi:uncharacterized damage-inducible protein DinB
MSHQTLRTPGAALASAVALLEQCQSFVASIGAAEYTTPSPLMFDATIGQHVRHALDHFAAALTALDGSTIDYDHRERETAIERDPGAARRAIADIIAALDGAPSSTPAQPVSIRVMLTSEGDECELASTFAREIAFATHHAVHHHAMMAAIARTMSVPVPAGFGKAPSTMDHARRAPGVRTRG